MPGCCVKNCRNSHAKRFRMFALPSGEKNALRLQRWLRLINRTDIKESHKICEVHFSSDQFENKRKDNKKLLKCNAVPDLLVEKAPESMAEPLREANIFPAKVFEPASFPSDSSANGLQAEHGNLTGEQVSENSPTFDNKEDFDPELEQFLARAASNTDQSIIIEQLKQKVRYMSRQCRIYKAKLEKQRENYDQLFNEDQREFISTANHRGTEWSEDTMSKALRLYMACGEKGYEEIRRQKLPYPSIRTIQYRLQNINLRPGARPL